MKKILFLLAAAVAVPMCASAATVEFTIDSTTMNKSDNTIEQTTLDAAPFIQGSRTMVPIRAIAESFNAAVDWDNQSSSVTVKKGEDEIVLTVGSESALVNNTACALDSAPVIVNDRTFVPLRFISEKLGYNVNYVNSSKQIVIDDTPVVFSGSKNSISYAQYETLYELLYQSNYESLLTQGASKDDAIQYLVDNTSSILFDICRFIDVFGSVSLSPEEIDVVNSLVAQERESVSIPLLGLHTLLDEQYYYCSLIAQDGMSISNEVINEFYEKNYVCAKHILVNDEKTAKDILKLASSGDDFDSLVAKYCTDPGMKAQPDGYVFTYGTMVEPFEIASFALTPGKISDIVKSDFGYHIIKREVLPELSDSVRSECVQMLIQQKLLTSSAEQKFSDSELMTLINS